MKREDVNQWITEAGVQDEAKRKSVVDAIMSANGQDVQAEKGKFAGLQAELNTANTTIQNLQNAAKQYEGVDVQGLRDQLSTLQTKYDTDVAALRRDSALDMYLIGRGARNVKAVRALLDEGRIKLDGDTLIGAKEQVDGIVQSDGYLFGDKAPEQPPVPAPAPVPAGPRLGSGGEHGGSGAEEDAAFMAAMLRGAGLRDEPTK